MTFDPASSLTPLEKRDLEKEDIGLDLNMAGLEGEDDGPLSVESLAAWGRDATFVIPLIWNKFKKSKRS